MKMGFVREVIKEQTCYYRCRRCKKIYAEEKTFRKHKKTHRNDPANNDGPGGADVEEQLPDGNESGNIELEPNGMAPDNLIVNEEEAKYNHQPSLHHLDPLPGAANEPHQGSPAHALEHLQELNQNVSHDKNLEDLGVHHTPSLDADPSKNITDISESDNSIEGGVEVAVEEEEDIGFGSQDSSLEGKVPSVCDEIEIEASSTEYTNIGSTEDSTGNTNIRDHDGKQIQSPDPAFLITNEVIEKTSRIVVTRNHVLNVPLSITVREFERDMSGGIQADEQAADPMYEPGPSTDWRKLYERSTSSEEENTGKVKTIDCPIRIAGRIFDTDRESVHSSADSECSKSLLTNLPATTSRKRRSDSAFPSSSLSSNSDDTQWNELAVKKTKQNHESSTSPKAYALRQRTSSPKQAPQIPEAEKISPAKEVPEAANRLLVSNLNLDNTPNEQNQSGSINQKQTQPDSVRNNKTDEHNALSNGTITIGNVQVTYPNTTNYAKSSLPTEPDDELQIIKVIPPKKKKVFSSWVTGRKRNRKKGGPQIKNCSFCSRSLDLSDPSARRPVRNGRTEIPVACNTCKEKYAEYRILIKPRMGDTLYECSKCGKDFNKKPALLYHFRRHTGEKPIIVKAEPPPESGIETSHDISAPDSFVIHENGIGTESTIEHNLSVNQNVSLNANQEQQKLGARKKTPPRYKTRQTGTVPTLRKRKSSVSYKI